MKEIISLFEKKKNLIIYKWYNYKPENKNYHRVIHIKINSLKDVNYINN